MKLKRRFYQGAKWKVESALSSPLQVWEELKSRKDIRPGRDAIAAILRICSSNRLLVGRATSIQAQMNQSNTKPNSAIYAAIIHCFRARGMLSEGLNEILDLI